MPAQTTLRTIELEAAISHTAALPTSSITSKRVLVENQIFINVHTQAANAASACCQLRYHDEKTLPRFKY